MAAEHPAWGLQVDDRIKVIAEKLDQEDLQHFSNEHVPGLKDLLQDYLNPNTETTNIDFHRGLLRTFKDSKKDNTYQDLLQQYTKDERDRLEIFVKGAKPAEAGKGFEMGPSLGCRQELEKMHEAKVVTVSKAKIEHVDGLSDDDIKKHDGAMHWMVHGLRKILHLHDDDDKDSVDVYRDAEFQNWGLNIKNKPQFTCVPRTVTVISRIVKFAKQHNMSVRCSGYRHSWSPIFGRTGQILISMLDLKTATRLPNTASLPFEESKPTELESIEIVPGTPRTKGSSLVRVGCATTNERLRRWCVKYNRVTLPLNVIMVEITLGGSNAPICHGAGRQNQTLSDIVRKIEYIDANGNLQEVTDPRHLRAASGCFGLMGVVTHLTLEFPPMTYARLEPKKMPVIRAVPPPPGMKQENIPAALCKYLPDSAEDQRKDQEEFERRATNDYYSEWFWFPYSDFSWVNTWNNTKDAQDVVNFPEDVHIFISFVQTSLLNVLQNAPVLSELIERTHLNEAAVTLISRAAMFALPEKQVKTYLPDALHFQRAIQNVRVRDIEVEMPLLPKPGAKDIPDYEIVQRAWWDAILEVYKHSDTCPMRMPLEMRIMGGSDVIMAPQRGNGPLGTCSIEVLTLHSASEIWTPFAQKVLDKWMSYTDTQGKQLNTRPHWAKEWKGFKIDGVDWATKLKNETYKNEIKEFNAVLDEIGKGKWTRSDLKNRFSNEFFDDFFFDDVEPTMSTATVAEIVESKSRTPAAKIATSVVEV